ncbi:hypothetical protein, conserved [Trypanosoma brucei gambiense DAL972]|uniref:EF-hand domain-containing protein n=2 Tax=Trypanosoma brucei TaxID=5691 RepID=C9ZV52_TRYB9|nr:hypothetical protein, conserved [Trypanosoma brucei gambiense DAL972]RHW70811.1 EF-hand domain pair/EF-hand domain/EF hand [Trypanosoma brucei equiperdum]CBH13290.1 hypothetical protein, conserved [Trypanosoma brucei gambiense DAL972]|eukprot:XP_011775567.1 hypothetical protein, conserved [Trypanosoma brucei gambiense DAL972]
MGCLPPDDLGPFVSDHVDVNEAEPVPLSDEDLDLLVRYSLLPTDVVREAWAVFNHYRVVECLRAQQRHYAMTGHLPQKSRVSMSARPFPVAECGGKLFTTPVRAASGDCNAVKEEEKAPVSPRDCVTGENSECRKEEVEVAVLGAEGLRQFFEDTGAPIPTLEVTSFLRRMSQPPVEYLLYQRALEEKLSGAAAAAAPPREESPGVGQRKKSPQTDQSKHNKGQSVGRGQRPNNNTKSLNILVDDHIDLLEEQRGSGGETVTFPLFLYILSNAELGKNFTADVRESEINTLFRTLDVDGDGVVSVDDIQRLLEERCSLGDTLYEDRDIRYLRGMNLTELKAALRECDVDEDGAVRLNDFRSVLSS